MKFQKQKNLLLNNKIDIILKNIYYSILVNQICSEVLEGEAKENRANRVRFLFSLKFLNNVRNRVS